MGLFHPSDNSIHLKVVYYGAAFGGKTTNLSWVKTLLDPVGEHGMLSVDTGDDSTLFFDYLPLRLRILDRYTVVIQGYTVPGQVRYNTTRRTVLNGADGVVFIADSRAERMDENRESLENLRQNLDELSFPPELPITLQWNQRDRDTAAPIADLEAALNPGGLPSCPAVSLRGEGVLETLRLSLREVWKRAHAEYGLDRRGLTEEDGLAALEAALRPADNAGVPFDPEGSRTHVRAAEEVGGADGDAAGSPTEGDSSALSSSGQEEDLLAAAVQSGIELATLSAMRAAERDAVEANLANARLTGQRVLHDVRKPLCALKNAIHVLSGERERLERPAALDLANAVIDEMSRQLSKAAACFENAGDSEDPKQRVQTVEVVESVLRQLSYPAADAGVELRSRGELPDLLWTREGLTSVLINLVGNAVRYHGSRNSDHDSGRRFVEVAGRMTRRGWILAVKDNGPGIDEAERIRVFERNTRGASSAGAAGSGLGLYLVSEQAKAIGARVGLRSTVGRGSLFYLVIGKDRLAELPLPQRSGVADPIL